jgi:hypothetical protein
LAAYDRARREGTRLKLVDKSGVKTIKSFALEMCAAEHVCNGFGDVAVFFGSESAAESTATTRILDFYRSIPRFQRKLETIRSRFDDTMGALKFPDKTLFILSANLGNTQQKNLAFVGLQDAFVTGKTGMIDEMIARTTQYEREAIIYLESQGGEKGFDFDRHYEDTDQRELHVNCPCCGTQHIFNWKAFDEGHMTRPEDFLAVLPKTDLAQLTLQGEASVTAAREELSKKLRGKVAGFKRGADELIKNVDGSYIEAAVLRETHFECYHCGGIWRDDGEFGPTRIALDQSAGKEENWVPARKDALPGNIGFNTPQWINRRLSWGKLMLEKLKNQRIARDTGNFEPIKKWWQKTAARTWDPEYMYQRTQTVSVGSYDPNQLIADEHSRNMAVDCQQEQDHFDRTGQSITGWFWYIVRIYDKFGNSKQLARGYVKRWEDWIAVQKHWKVPNSRVVVDVDHWGTQIMAKAAECRDIIKVEKPLPPFYLRERTETWYLFAAENRKVNFKHRDGQVRPWSPAQPVSTNAISVDGKLLRVMLNRIRWEKRAIQLQLDAIRSGAPGMPKFEVLAREQLKLPNGEPDKLTLEMEQGNCTYQKQMDAQYFVPEENKYKELRPDDHYSWCEQALLVRQAMDGLFGHSGVFATEGAATE